MNNINIVVVVNGRHGIFIMAYVSFCNFIDQITGIQNHILTHKILKGNHLCSKSLISYCTSRDINDTINAVD